MKKLIPAFALLLVSAVLMSTASFAWFSMNKTVTATNMQIKAAVPRQLLISDDNSTWGAEMTLSSDTTMGETVVPVTAYDLTVGNTLTNTFYRMTTAGMKLVDEAGLNHLTYTKATIATIQVDNDTTGTEALAFETTAVDHYQDNIYLRLAGDLPSTAADATVSAKAKITNKETAGNDLDVITNALHIVIVDETNKVLLNVDCGTANAAISPESGEAYKEIDLGDVFEFTSTNKDSQQLTVFVFYWGEDTNCFNNNAAVVDGLIIDIEFELG